MTLSDIREMPTTIDSGPNRQRVHESCLRSYHIVNFVVELAKESCPPAIMLMLIDDLRSAQQKVKEINP